MHVVAFGISKSGSSVLLAMVYSSGSLSPGIGESPSGKAAAFEAAIRGFESLLPSHRKDKPKTLILGLLNLQIQSDTIQLLANEFVAIHNSG